MRAAQIDKNNVVINYAEVNSFGGEFIAPLDSVIGSTWNGTIFSAPPTPSILVPKFVTMRQGRTALLNAGLLDSVNTLIAGMSGDAGKKAQIDWAYSSDLYRNWPLVNSLAPGLGLTSTDIDNLFIAAMKL